jgi:hypothetical protein
MRRGFLNRVQKFDSCRGHCVVGSGRARTLETIPAGGRYPTWWCGRFRPAGSSTSPTVTAATTTITLQNLTITNYAGSLFNYGAGIHSYGTLLVKNSTITANGPAAN